MGTNYHNEARRKQRVIDRQLDSVMRMTVQDSRCESAAKNDLSPGKKAVEDVIRRYHAGKYPPSDPTWTQIKRELILDDIALRNANLYFGHPSVAKEMETYERKNWKKK